MCTNGSRFTRVNPRKYTVDMLPIKKRKYSAEQQQYAQKKYKPQPFMLTTPYKRTISSRSIEKKFIDVVIGLTATTTAGAITGHSMNLVAQGVTDVTRVGNKITVKNINVRLHLQMVSQASIAPVNDVVRFVMYIDKQCNGQDCAVADILQQTSNTYAFRNMDQTDRFIILKDKFVPLYLTTVDAALGSSGIARMLKFSKKLDLPIHYSSTTGAITEVKSNNIGWFIMSENAVASFSGQMRMKFVDL